MLPCPELLTPPSIPTPEYISYTSFQLLKSSLLLVQINADPCMANSRERQNSQQWSIPLEIQSAYWANTNSSAPANPNTSDDRRFLSVRQPAEAPYSNASPASSSDVKKRNPASLLSLIRRRSDAESSTLQPDSNVNPSSASLSPYSYYPQHHSQSLEPLRPAPANLPAHRSMPSSPLHSAQPPPFSRALSAHVEPTSSLEASPQRYSSLEAPAARSPRASRTFPETQWETAAAPPPPPRPRRQTWLEPFDDASQFHLFVEATSGLPDDAGIRPASPLSATPTLFTRPTTAAPQPAPQSYYQHPPPQFQTPQYDALAPPLAQPLLRTSSQRFAAELEQLEGDEEMPDEELPNYAQSQAEMNARRRIEAARRAAELERSWARARGRR